MRLKNLQQIEIQNIYIIYFINMQIAEIIISQNFQNESSFQNSFDYEFILYF